MWWSRNRTFLSLSLSLYKHNHSFVTCIVVIAGVSTLLCWSPRMHVAAYLRVIVEIVVPTVATVFAAIHTIKVHVPHQRHVHPVVHVVNLIAVVVNVVRMDVGVHVAHVHQRRNATTTNNAPLRLLRLLSRERHRYSVGDMCTIHMWHTYHLIYVSFSPLLPSPRLSSPPLSSPLLPSPPLSSPLLASDRTSG
jgi:hypothetical protein